MALSLCHIARPTVLYDERSRKFVNGFADLMNFYLYGLFDGKHFNVSIVTKNTVGFYDAKTSLYTGCLGGIQDGSIDAILYPVPVPHFDNFMSYGILFKEDPVEIVSYYNSTDSFITKSLSDCFDGQVFSAFLIVVICITIYFQLLFFVRKVTRFVSIDVALFLMLLKNLNFKNDIKLKHRYFFLIILLSAAFDVYGRNFIKSELSTPRYPMMIDTYDKILKSETITAFWLETFTPTNLFENARVGSHERLIYERARKNGLNNSVYLSAYEAQSAIADLASQKSVALIPSEQARAVIDFMCRVNDFDGPLPIRRKDTDAINIPKLTLFRSNLHPKVTRNLLKRQIRVFESGIEKFLFATSNSGSQGSRKMKVCTSNVVELQNPPLPLLKLGDIVSITSLIGSLALMVLVVLVSEFSRSYLIKKRKSRRVTQNGSRSALERNTRSIGQSRVDWSKRGVRPRRVQRSASSVYDRYLLKEIQKLPARRTHVMLV